MNILRLKDLLVELECLAENHSLNDKVKIEKDKIIILDENGNEKDSFETLYV
jgi:hypothetical protein